MFRTTLTCLREFQFDRNKDKVLGRNLHLLVAAGLGFHERQVVTAKDLPQLITA